MKECTHNQYSKSVNIAIDYINKHLNECINLKEIANVAFLSEYHFHRIFKFYVGESVGAYITRLRLEKSANILQTSNKTLNETADAIGYKSQQSLSKAFKNHFGINPSAFRNINSYLQPKNHISKNNFSELKYRTVQIQTKKLVYTRIIAKYGSEPNYKKAWDKIYSFAKNKNLIENDSEYIGINFDDPNITKKTMCRFYACISTQKNINPFGEFGIYTIEAGKFAMFTHKGEYSELNSLYQAIYTNWIPKHYDKIRNNSSFEKYLNSPDKVKGNELLTEIYIPIKN